MKPTAIKLPNLSPQHFTNKSVTITPYTNVYRQGGIRLEQQLIKQKYIYHNYGQGQSEFSLAYGCSYIVSKMITLRKEDVKTRDVAVIGNGINSLLTAMQLLKRGHKVTLYTENMPVQGKKNQKVVPAGTGYQLWYPGDYDNSDPLKHELLSKLSFEFYQQCLVSNRYQSLKLTTLYTSGPKSQQIRQNVTQFISKQIGYIPITFENQKVQQYGYFKTIQVDTELFIEQLYTELRLRNINIIKQKFNTLDDIMKLKEQFVYNCLGIQSKNIFKDDRIREIPNINVNIYAQDCLKQVKDEFVIWNSSEVSQQEDFIIYVTKKRLQITSKNRLIHNLNENLEKNKQKLLGKAYNFIKQRANKPYKL